MLGDSSIVQILFMSIFGNYADFRYIMPWYLV